MNELRYLENVSTLKLDAEKCIGCGMCAMVCPHGVLTVEEHKVQIVDLNACIECGACAGNCPVEALTVKSGVGCASAIIHGWLTGEEPNCDCGGSC
ncbi:MAG: mercury methylation ferredoxin HgcB [Desulfuromonadales bacterium]|jgi:ferredoxin